MVKFLFSYIVLRIENRVGASATRPRFVWHKKGQGDYTPAFESIASKLYSTLFSAFKKPCVVATNP